jgi:AcrR family transcriptional regulator
VARHVKPDEYAAHRRQILVAARKLAHDKGYEHMTVQDVLDELQISKGALYHYFDSKQSLLEGIVESMGESGGATLRAVVDDPHLDAVEKLNAYFAVSTAWKADALLSQKLSQESIRSTTTPLLEAIIKQGGAEGVFDTAHPHDAAVILAGMGLHLADAVICSAAYTDAFERILGAPSGSLTLA